MKKIAAIFLLIIMIVCSSGFYLSYHLSLYSIHLQQREVIKNHQELFKDMILEIRVPENYATDENIDLRFEEEDEVMFNGKMYDIISRQSSADSLFLRCIPDPGEDEIRDLASNEIFSNDGKTASQKENALIKFNPGLFTNFAGEQSSGFFEINKRAYYLTYIIKKISVPYQNTPSPPPWPNL